MTFAIITLTTNTNTTSVVASSVGSFERRVSNNKSNKKQSNKKEENTCTIQPFLGKSQYTNCRGKETEVEIACDTTDDAAPATTTTREICLYSEHPVQYDAAAATAVECGVRGSFDPRTHLTWDHATGVCRLDFIALDNSCDAAPVVAGGGFGVMMEVPLSTGTGLGPYHHEQNEAPHQENSGMLLRFSTNGGVTFYNQQDPRKTVLLDSSCPQRKLDVRDPGACHPASGAFGGVSTTTSIGKNSAFETCYQLAEEVKYCWTKSYKSPGCTLNPYEENDDGFYQCAPNGAAWHDLDPQYVNTPGVDPETNPKRCGPPCQGQHEEQSF